MSKPVILVHGGMSGAWEWEGVVAELGKRGVSATTIDLPSRSPGASLADDEQAVRALIDHADEPVVLVGHSYSGAVIGAASAGNPKVAHLVFVAAAVVEEGQSVRSSFTNSPQEPVEVPRDNSDYSPSDDATQRALFSDLSDDEFNEVRPKIGSISRRVMTEIPSGFGWKEHPYSYVLATADVIMPPELQRRYAAHAERVVEVDAGHSPMWKRPAEVAAVIADAAQAL